MSIFWILALTLGAGGGGLNAAAAGHLRLLPSMVAATPHGTQLVHIGVIGNLLTGVIGASLLCAVGLTSSSLGMPNGLPLIAAFDLLVGFLSARFVTNEIDKRVLRRAIYKAVSAPAAHPDTVEVIEVAAPGTIYMMVDQLLPRRAGHR